MLSSTEQTQLGVSSTWVPPHLNTREYYLLSSTEQTQLRVSSTWVPPHQNTRGYNLLSSTVQAQLGVSTNWVTPHMDSRGNNSLSGGGGYATNATQLNKLNKNTQERRILDKKIIYIKYMSRLIFYFAKVMTKKSLIE